MQFKVQIKGCEASLDASFARELVVECAATCRIMSKHLYKYICNVAPSKDTHNLIVTIKEKPRPDASLSIRPDEMNRPISAHDVDEDAMHGGILRLISGKLNADY